MSVKNFLISLVAKMYEVGQAIEAASFLEIDAVIDPSRNKKYVCLKLFKSAARKYHEKNIHWSFCCFFAFMDPLFYSNI